jgi:hypothetical protein
MTTTTTTTTTATTTTSSSSSSSSTPPTPPTTTRPKNSYNAYSSVILGDCWTEDRFAERCVASFFA